MEEREFWERVDAGVLLVRDAADPWDAYDRAMEVAGEASDQMSTNALAGSAYYLWASLTDLFDDQRPGRIPSTGAQVILRQVAEEWLATPVHQRGALIEDWLGRDWIAMIREAGFTVGPPRNPAVEQPWRGQWEDIAWTVAQIGVTHSVFAAAERVLRDIAATLASWEAGSGDVLQSLVRQWEEDKERRPEIDVAIKEHLLRLRAEDLPALEPLSWPED